MNRGGSPPEKKATGLLLAHPVRGKGQRFPRLLSPPPGLSKYRANRRMVDLLVLSPIFPDLDLSPRPGENAADTVFQRFLAQAGIADSLLTERIAELLVDEIRERRRRNLATVRQLVVMLNLNYPGAVLEVDFITASRWIGTALAGEKAKIVNPASPRRRAE